MPSLQNLGSWSFLNPVKNSGLGSNSIKNVALNPSTKLGLCGGDCDSDNDCTSGLKCFQRNGWEPGPLECHGSMVEGWDYCYLPTKVHSASGYFASRYIDEIFIISTHNSLALPGKVLSPNQNHGLGTQFRDGIRGFNFDLYNDGSSQIETCHGGDWCTNPMDDFDELISELDKNPNEFIVVQLQSQLDDKRNNVLKAKFGHRLVTNFDPNRKLGTYLEQGQQVLMVTDRNPDVFGDIKIHNTNYFISENDYSWKNRYGSPPMGHRRGPKNPNQSKKYMRNMNYFITVLGGDMVASYVVHDVERALGHIRNFEKQSYSGGKINTILVDYYR